MVKKRASIIQKQIICYACESIENQFIVASVQQKGSFISNRWESFKLYKLETKLYAVLIKRIDLLARYDEVVNMNSKFFFSIELNYNLLFFFVLERI